MSPAIDTFDPKIRAELLSEKGQAIAREVAEYFQLSVAEIMGIGRTRRVSHARRLVMASLWQMGFSTTEIGGFFQRSNAATAHAIRTLNVNRRIVGSKMVKQPINLDYNTSLKGGES